MPERDRGPYGASNGALLPINEVSRALARQPSNASGDSKNGARAGSPGRLFNLLGNPSYRRRLGRRSHPTFRLGPFERPQILVPDAEIRHCRVWLKPCAGRRGIRRFARIFDWLFIDESQDLSGYDLELVEYRLKSGSEITLVGDNRQATYTTNDSGRNKKYARSNIVDKFKEWEGAKLCSIEYQTGSRRCVQEICDFADLFFPGAQKTQSLNSILTGHDGIFAVEKRLVADYCAKFDSPTAAL